MKTVWRVLVLLVLIVPATGCAGDNNSRGSISVAGQASQAVVPDEVVWVVNISSVNQELKKAKQDNDKKLQSVLRAGAKIARDEKDVESGQLHVDRQYEWDKPGGSRKFSHFSVRRTVKIRQRDLDKFEEAFDRLIKSAEIELRFQYDISNEDELRHELKLQALDAAREKAGDMVERLDRKLDNVISISEFPPGSGRLGAVPEMAMSARADDRSSQATPEARVLTEVVYVIFGMK